jgi:acyl dehydratase
MATGMSFEDIQVGTPIGRLTKGPMSPAHIMRWSSAMENWHRIHYDRPFATEHDKLPDVLVNGSWKQHVLVQLMKDSLGPDGWLWRIKFRYTAMDVAWDTLHGLAEPIEKRVIGGLGFVLCKIALSNQREQVTTVGTAIGVLPLRGGPAVPYPFVPTPEQQAFRLPD